VEQEALRGAKGEFFIDNLLVRVHFITVMIRWTGLAPWEFEFPFPGSLTSTFLIDAPCPCNSLRLAPTLQGYLAPKKPHSP